MKALDIKLNLLSCQYDEMDSEDRLLVDKAKEATYRSYSPYSRFSVGAALLLEHGEIVLGCNNENAAYGVTICAERTAIFSAQAQYPDVPIRKLAVAARNTEGNFLSDPVTPCGICRQAIVELEYRYKSPVRVIMIGESNIIVASSVRDILPLSFVADDMEP